MNKTFAMLSLSAFVLASLSNAQAPTNTPATAHQYSIQQVLSFNSTAMRMHALATITREKTGETINESYLPGFKACSTDKASSIRSVTARLLGEHFIEGKNPSNPEALAILQKLSKDESADVRYNALHYGLTQVEPKSDQLIEELVEAAVVNREENLYDRIIVAISENKTHAKNYLAGKIKDESSIAYFEIYRDLTGGNPPNSENYLNLPSTQPRLYVFTTKNQDKNAAATDLEKWVSGLGIESFYVEVSGYAGQRVLLLTTYITRDHETVEAKLNDTNEQFDFMQKFWLTPKLAAEIDTVRANEKRKKGKR
ncbi:hypothetical protein PDESU_04703 [Pontiella desulfatans]|uniref:HEAT repeat domain-containing protein n=1 Tax=Pontiella desulfatans TaxID=2750659 RepID=A0A6C2U8G3_PONDE|nr:HEAT repeat domain-containing protein [Pontiella desulfatans]VGO16113.1 hypothetical protein PDESU_04703 [Pontiella desulfatans]